MLSTSNKRPASPDQNSNKKQKTINNKTEWEVYKHSKDLPATSLAFNLAILVENYIDNNANILMKNDIDGFMESIYKKKFSSEQCYYNLRKLSKLGLIEKLGHRGGYRLVEKISFAFEKMASYSGYQKQYKEFQQVFAFIAKYYPDSIFNKFPFTQASEVVDFNSLDADLKLFEITPEIKHTYSFLQGQLSIVFQGSSNEIMQAAALSPIAIKEELSLLYPQIHENHSLTEISTDDLDNSNENIQSHL